MTYLNAFKLEYNWYEGEHNSVHLVKDVNEIQFEKDLKEAIKIVSRIRNKENEHVSLPDKYYFTIDEMEKMGYHTVYINDKTTYEIDDEYNGTLYITSISTERKEIIRERSQ